MPQLSLHSRASRRIRKEPSSWKAPCWWVRFSPKVPACVRQREAGRSGMAPARLTDVVGSLLTIPAHSPKLCQDLELELGIQAGATLHPNPHRALGAKQNSSSQFGFVQKNYSSQKPLTVVFLTSQTDGLEIVFTVYFLNISICEEPV